MTRRPPPQPTTVSGYFFHQLVPGEPTADAATVRMSSAVASVLRRSFTPADATSLLQRTAEAEGERTDTLEDSVVAAWGRVEEVQARNRGRRRALDEELQRAIAEMDALSFWTPESAAVHYDLPEPGTGVCADSEDYEDTTEIKDTEESKELKDTEESKELKDTEESKELKDTEESKELKDTQEFKGLKATEEFKVRVTKPPRRARAFGRSDRDLLDPTRQPHCLRRLFAPLLQRRAALPRSLTLLLRALQRVQTEDLPVMEDVMGKGFFPLPLHRPLRYIAVFISQYLSQESRTAAPEVAFLEMYKASATTLSDAHSHLRALESSPKGGDAAEEVIYGTLHAELRGRRDLGAQCDEALRDITSSAETQLSAMEHALDTCDVESRQALERIQRDADDYIARLREISDRMAAALAEVHSVFEREESRVAGALRARHYAAERSEQQQELLARRVREATKALFKEQQRYEALTQEIITDTVTLRQLQLSHAQLAEFLDARVLAEGAAEKTEWVTDAVRRADEVRTDLIAQCRAHVMRLRVDERYRRCRVVAHARDNALAWSRCLQDLAELYEGHYDNLSSKLRESMQLRYLLSYEKGQAVGNLHQLQREMNHLDERWGDIAAALEELEMEIPSLTKCETEEECRETRRVIREQDSRRLIRRKYTRLLPQEEKQVDAADLGGLC